MAVVRRAREGASVPELARELGIHRKLIYQWLRQVSEGGEENLRPRGRPPGSESASVARRTEPVVHFLRAVICELMDAAKDRSACREAIYRTVESMVRRQSGLSVELMCELAGVARCGYYRYLGRRASR